ncbi:hypothetical protein DM02DRAFT_634823 [Periconia macrospinosa]|uniref:Uncharacterized protein n=1 Tax=Periconia macrospinosa TaxID=97972 RepID=A0A2V1D6D2_9PLEO|nr:hypothetical protein DM02DRAFT_634823 [Periconia macrospinosa]
MCCSASCRIKCLGTKKKRWPALSTRAGIGFGTPLVTPPLTQPPPTLTNTSSLTGGYNLSTLADIDFGIPTATQPPLLSPEIYPPPKTYPPPDAHPQSYDPKVHQEEEGDAEAHQEGKCTHLYQRYNLYTSVNARITVEAKF